MNTLSSTESYVLSILGNLKDNASLDLDNLTSMLLGFYICTILDPVEQIKENDLIDTIENLQKENTLLHVLEKEKNLNLLNIKKETLFDNFILNDVAIEDKLYKRIYPHTVRPERRLLIPELVEGSKKPKSKDERYLSFDFGAAHLCSGRTAKGDSPPCREELNCRSVMYENCYNIIIKKALSAFNQKIITAFGIEKKKHSKYEVRFFWPSPAYPEVYELYGLIFNKKDYTHIITTDKYILTKNNINIKIRKDELQIKKCIQTINGISRFKKKKKIPFPIKAKKINDLFKQTVISDSEPIRTPEDLILKLSNIPGISCIDLSKERYVRKMEDHIKIEFALLNIQEKQWKTICIESKSLQKILALSLLINQENAEKLSYDAFLHKYALSTH
jgi:hypothetical protein